MANYVLLNPPATPQAARSGKFVYVLLFNVPGSPEGIPYYVGVTSGLTARFADHGRIIWHRAKFDAPPAVWIAGQVPASDVDAAEQDLILRLTAAGYLLANTFIANSWAKAYQHDALLAGFTAEQVRAYLGAPRPKTHVLADWSRRWCPEPPATAGLLGTEAVVRYVAGLEYPSELVRDVSVAIAAAHDPELGFSRIVLADALHGMPGAKRVYLHPRKLTGVWVFNRAIDPAQPHDFRLTKHHLSAVSAGG
ncbi:MAG: hypothetical protein ABWX68_12875 [Arthrobacter sp.]|uniref:hypothetical protein n=1 Tax=Arthrobacter sp. TaxID=1667 RepID=UPI003490C454